MRATITLSLSQRERVRETLTLTRSLYHPLTLSPSHSLTLFLSHTLAPAVARPVADDGGEERHDRRVVQKRLFAFWWQQLGRLVNSWWDASAAVRTPR